MTGVNLTPLVQNANFLVADRGSIYKYQKLTKTKNHQNNRLIPVTTITAGQRHFYYILLSLLNYTRSLLEKVSSLYIQNTRL